MSIIDTIAQLWGDRPSISADDDQSTQTGIYDPSSHSNSSTPGYHALDKMYKSLAADSSRMDLYLAYAEMEEFTPEVEKALNFYADYAASGQTTEGESAIRFTSKNGVFDRRLEKIDDVVQLGKQAWAIIRGMCQFGDQFYENVFSDFGLAGLRALPKNTMYRIEDEYGILQGFEQRITKSKEVIEFEDFQISHFRLRVDESKKYGRSILWSLRRLTMELALMDQAMTIERLSNAHRRLKVTVDVGTDAKDENAIRKAINLVREINRRVRSIDPKTGKMRLKHNPLRAEEDIYIPSYKGSPADVDVLPASEAGKNVKDMVMKWERLFAGLGPPMSWYGLTGPNVRAVIKDQALNFMRTVRRIRKDFEREAVKAYQIALMVQYNIPWERVWKANVSIAWPQMSHADDLLAMELDELRAKVAKMFKELKLMSRRDMLITLFKKTPTVADELLANVSEDETIMGSDDVANGDDDEKDVDEPDEIEAPSDMLERLVARYPEASQLAKNITMLIDEIETNSGRF